METREFWRWWIFDEVTGKRRATTWHMTAETAPGYPGAERVAGTLELRPAAPARDASALAVGPSVKTRGT